MLQEHAYKQYIFKFIMQIVVHEDMEKKTPMQQTNKMCDFVQ